MSLWGVNYVIMAVDPRFVVYLC